MAPAKPMLGEIELQLVQKLDAEQDQTLTQHSVPALEGDFLQRLGRRASRFVLSGVMTGDESADDLKTLRAQFRAGDPVSFVSDIATATKVDQVLIEELVVRELAGRPERFAYTLTLRELLTPPENVVEDGETTTDEEDPDLPDVLVGSLEVELTVEGAPDFDFGSVTVTAETTGADGVSSTRTLTARTENIWTEQNLPPGQYTVRARTADAPQADTAGAASLQPPPAGALSNTPPISALGAGQVQGGQRTQVQLQASVTAPVAVMFAVHFRFDKSFVEPCEREVLRQAIDFSNQPANSSLKLLVVGHADKSGSSAYNQSLSERRARAVYAYLTFGRDAAAETAAFNDWENLRLNPRAGRTDLNDRWELREAQHMLQALNFYAGNVDNRDGRLTQEAIRAFRCHKGLPPGTNLDNDVWSALIRDYLKDESFAVPAARFLTNCPNEILKWLGCGEDDPLRNTSAPHRPSRRVELLFVNASALPCQVPQPATFDLPAPGGAVNSGWCVGGAGATSRTCFVSTHIVPRSNNVAQPCSTSPTGPWCRRPANPGTITLQGSILNEDGTPAARQPFVINAPSGEFLAREDGAGEPIRGFTNARGEFSFPGKTIGFYSIAVLSKDNQPELLVRLDGAGDETIRGNVACKAIRSDGDRLSVVIVAAPLLREVVLPTVVHLITMTEFQAPNAPRSRVAYSSARSADRVRAGFVVVNRIWRQARIRFDVVDIVRRTAQRENPLIDPPGPAMSNSDLSRLLINDTYPGVVNVFVVPDVQTSSITGEAGATTSPEQSPSSHGVSVEDLLTSSPATGSRPLGDEPWGKITAHELGHYLNLTYGSAPHPDQEPGATGPFDRRLMRSTVDLNTTNDTQLIDSEIQQARASLAAAAECRPLELIVTGAQPLGGRFSGDFIAIRSTTGEVSIEATGEPLFLARGAVTWTGSTVDAANPRRSTVSRNATASPVTVVAELLGVTRRVRIFVVDFPELTVQGPGRMAPGTTNYFVRRDSTPAAPRLRIIARPTPTPHAVPDDIVAWNNTTDAAPESPLERLLSINAVPNAPVVVNATIAGVTRTVTVAVLEVALVSNDPPGAAVDPVLIEGIVNDDRLVNRGTFAVADLVSTQPRSLFRARAEIPGVAGAGVQGFFVSRDPGGREIERVAVTLQRAAGNVFLTQRPLLVIPEVIPRADVQTVDIDFVRARAGGTLRLELTGFADQAQAQAQTRGRVVTLRVTAFRGSGVTRANIDASVLRAQQTWAQAGMEVEAPTINVDVVPPQARLLDIDTQDPTGINLTQDEQLLVATVPALQARENDLHIFYVRDIIDVSPTANPNSDVNGIAYPNNRVIVLQGPSVINNSAFAHEIGHKLLISWPGQEHQDTSATDWPRANVMHPQNTSDGRDVDRTQADNLVRFSVLRRFHRLLPP